MPCRLCGTDVELKRSHIIPKFATKWLKDTSATGYFRNVVRPNLRIQDSIREKMLCAECEEAFSVNEKTFAENIFVPFVTEELDEWGNARGKIEGFIYDERLLQFALSVSWRVLARSLDQGIDDINDKCLSRVRRQEESIRQFLLGNTNNTGDNSTHVLFLQNLIGGSGSLPPRMHPGVNSYLLRSNDATMLISENGKQAHTFAKLGPIVILTALCPSSLDDFASTLIDEKGKLSTIQELCNLDICEFIYITRPNESLPKLVYSEKQKKKITETLAADPERAMKSMSIKAVESKRIMKAIQDK